MSVIENPWRFVPAGHFPSTDLINVTSARIYSGSTGTILRPVKSNYPITRPEYNHNRNGPFLTRYGQMKRCAEIAAVSARKKMAPRRTFLQWSLSQVELRSIRLSLYVSRDDGVLPSLLIKLHFGHSEEEDKFQRVGASRSFRWFKQQISNLVVEITDKLASQLQIPKVVVYPLIVSGMLLMTTLVSYLTGFEPAANSRQRIPKDIRWIQDLPWKWFST